MFLLDPLLLVVAKLFTKHNADTATATTLTQQDSQLFWRSGRSERCQLSTGKPPAKLTTPTHPPTHSPTPQHKA